MSPEHKEKLRLGREAKRMQNKASGQGSGAGKPKKFSKVAWIVPAHTKGTKTFEAADGETISRPTAKSNANRLYYTLEKYTHDRYSGITKPEYISCSDNMPFRTDTSEAVKKYRFSSEDVCDLLANDPGLDSMFHIRYITQEEIDLEAKLAADKKALKLVRDRIALIEGQNPVARPQASTPADTVPEIMPKMSGLPSDYYKGGNGTSIPEDSGVPAHLHGIVPDRVI